MQTSAWMPIADGEAGIRQILGHLRTVVDYYGTLPVIRAAALRIAGVRSNHDQGANVVRLAEFVRHAVKYQADPYNAELTQTPDVLLLAINRQGFAWGDCDDHCALFCTLCLSLGIYCEIVGVMAEGTDFFNHVICVAYPNDRRVEVDLCAKEGYQPAYPAQLQA